MPTRILMLTLACLAFASSAEAGNTWLGAELQYPVPARDIGSARLGGGAGVTFTRMANAHFGIGADLIYHYWPASPAYEAAFDRYLRSERMESLQGSDWAMSAFQMTGHVKLVAPIGKRYSSWMQVGAGAYELNLNLDPRRPEGTYAWVTAQSNARSVPGVYGGVGLDLHASSHEVLGVDATYQYVVSGEKSTWGFGGMNDLQDFSAVTVGVHALFGVN